MAIIIKVREFLNNPLAVSTDKAENIFMQCKDIIENDGNIILDFDDVKLVITAFLNISIGKLYGLNFDFKTIDKKIEFQNASPSIKKMIDKVIENSKKYYLNREEGIKNNSYLNRSIDGDI